MRRAFSLLVILAFLAAALAGCTSTYEGPKEFTVPKDAGPVGEQQGVSDPFTLIVVVTDVDASEPIEGAAVVFFHAVTTRDGGFFFSDSRTEYRAVAAARTDADGQALGKLEPGGAVSVGVGDVEGRTNEIRPEVAVGQAGGSTNLTIPLYATARSATVQEDLGLRATHPGSQVDQAEPERLPVPLRFSEDNATNLGYTKRLATIDITIRWNNTPPDFADLRAGLRTPDGQVEWLGPDERQIPTGTDLRENLSLERDALDERRDAFAQTGLEMEAVTDEPILTVDGIPVGFQGDATFYASDLIIYS